MAGVLYQVNGPFAVFVRGSVFGGGSSGPWQWLGLSQSKAYIRINNHYGRVMADNAGPAIPVDMQRFGSDANIPVTFSQFYPSLLDDALASDPVLPVGSIGSIGEFMAASGKAFQINIISNYAPWFFGTCICSSQNHGLSTEYSTIPVEFYAWAYVGN